MKLFNAPKILVFFVSALLLTACGAGSGDAIATGIAQTLQISELETAAAAGEAAATQAAAPSVTPTASETAQPSATATNTPAPTNTSAPLATDTPSGPPPQVFAGHWFTNSGTLDIVQNQRDFTGTLYNAFNNSTKSISGTIAGDQLTSSDGVSLTLAAGGLAVSGYDQNGAELCGALPGHHFPMGCSFAGQWSTYREPTSACDSQLLTLVREDNTVSGSYCSNRTIRGTISYPGGGNTTIFDGTLLGADGSTLYPVRLWLVDIGGTQFIGNWSNGSYPFCGWQSPASMPSPCKWP